MKIFLLTLGTRGDVELFLALGRELRRRGHRVLVGSSSFYATRTADCGLEWVQIGAGTEGQMRQVLRGMSALADGEQRAREYIRQWVGPQLTQSARMVVLCAASADYFISNLKMSVNKRAQVVPGAFVTYEVPRAVADLDRPDSRTHGGRIIDLVALNRALVDPGRAWDGRFRFTGFWAEPQPAEWTPPDDLARFLSRHPGPAVVTLGSMSPAGEGGADKGGADEGGLVRGIAEALRIAGRRGIFLGNIAAAARASGSGDDFYFGGDVPYHWLFPRAACVVHHGGVGTAAAAIAAGVPCVVLPQISAQESLAGALMRAGLASGVFDTRSLDVGGLGAAIESAARDEKRRETARAWRAEVSRDRGVLAAADLIEQHHATLAPLAAGAAPCSPGQAG